MATAAALFDHARRDIQHHFFSADAVRPDRAVPFSPSGTVELRQFETMLERGIMMREGADRYWINIVAYDLDLRAHYNRSRNSLRVAIPLLAVSLIALAITYGNPFAT